MGHLTKAQIDAIKKCSNTRLIAKLLSVGYTEEQLDAMDREALLQAWATCVAEGKDKTFDPVKPLVPLGYDIELERQKLEFEKSKFEAQQASQVKEHQMKLQMKQMEIEAQEKLKQAELIIKERKYAADREEKDSVIARAKRYGDAIKASLTVMGPEPLDVVSFFRHIEAVFDRYQVPSNLQAALLQLYLNAKARNVVARMDPTLYHEYNAVRDVILKEHELSPRSYLEFFNSPSRSSGETYVMYCARLLSLIHI